MEKTIDVYGPIRIRDYESIKVVCGFREGVAMLL